MNRLKFLVAAFAILGSALGIYSCNKDGVIQEEQSNLNVELRSRCGDNSNLAPTPSYTVYSNGTLCCYTFTFSSNHSGLSYSIYGLNQNGTFLGDPTNTTTYCSGTLTSNGSTLTCCFDVSVKTVNISLSNGSCVNILLSGC